MSSIETAKATPKKIVLRRYPDAWSSVDKAYGWRVYGRTGDGFCIGWGARPQDAWEDAAEFVRRYGG